MPDRHKTALDIVTLQTRLLRYAKSQLRNEALAEDAVSETLLAALESQRTFDTLPQTTAWVFGVLKHKLVDQLRAQHRETPAGDLAADCDSALPAWTGAWQQDRALWQDPELACQQHEFIDLVTRCCQALPATQSRAFLMRELLDMDTTSICCQLAVSEGNLSVLIHRARTRLRRALAGYRRLATGRRNDNAVA